MRLPCGMETARKSTDCYLLRLINTVYLVGYFVNGFNYEVEGATFLFYLCCTENRFFLLELIFFRNIVQT
jgi:hypothetical protein